MAGYEQTIIVGNVGRDPEMKYMPSGTAVASFSVAVTTRWNDRQTNERKERTNWYNVSCWSKLAEIANQYVKKGTQIMVVGTVSSRAYIAQDGEARSSLDLRADTFQLLSGNGAGGGGGDYGGGNDYGGSSQPRDIDDIPF